MKRKKRKPQNFFLLEDQPVPYVESDTVLEALLHSEIPIDHSCGGMGSCSTCRVVVLSDLTEISDRTIPEQEIAQDRGFDKTERLSCQFRPCPTLKIRIP